MTLEHSFPGLRSSPGGAIVAVADTLFDLTGPANAMTAEVLQNHARQIMEEIKAINPFVQQRADDANDRGMALLKAGRLRRRLSDQEALGNYVDQQVWVTLRERYNKFGIDLSGAGPVRVKSPGEH